MALEMFCGPSLLYLGFSIIQIIIDIYKGLYNTTFIKFIVMILFTVFLNILCKSGLTVISWLIVFIPFISMTVITTLLLFVFGLDPSQGSLNYQVMDLNGSFTHTTSGKWRIVFPNGSYEIVTVTTGQFIMLGQQFQLLDTSPVSFRWMDGTIHTMEGIDQNGMIRWTTDNQQSEYQNLMWIPVSEFDSDRRGLPSNITPEPCPPNVTPEQYSSYYGGVCMTGNQLSSLNSNSSGTFRVSYYDGTSEIITLNNGTFTADSITYSIRNSNPLTIEWSDGTIQTLELTDDNFIRWRTTSEEPRYSVIIWEPINDGLQIPQIPTTPSTNNQFNNSALSTCVPSCIQTCNNNPNRSPTLDCNEYCNQECQRLF